MTPHVLPEAPAHLLERTTGVLYDMKDISGTDRTLGSGQAIAFFCPWKGSSVAIWIPERKPSPRSASPEIVAPSKRNCRIAQRIARTPKRALGAHTEWFCSMKVAIWQVCSRHIQRRLNHRIRTGIPA